MLREQLQLAGERVGWMRFREEAEGKGTTSHGKREV